MLAVYIHIPFCRQRCLYCDFITYAGKQDLIPAYIQALCTEIKSLGLGVGGSKQQVETIYFGGGTPSLLEPAEVETCLGSVQAAFGLDSRAEITLETNPGTVQSGKLKAFRSAGINRLSLGVQSFSDQELYTLGRIHSIEDVYKSVRAARFAGFDNLSLDLIFGIPGQQLVGWQENLRKACELEPEHLSLYSLTLEPGTVLADRVDRGMLEVPDQDASADMFEMCMEYLTQKGYDHYEISNWAVDEARESRHNKTYWKNQPYLGIGAAAHGCACGYRVENVPEIQDYIDRITAGNERLLFPFSQANLKRTALDEKTTMQETMLLGLRLVREGVSCKEFEQRFHQDARTVFSQEIARLLSKNLVEWANFPDGEHLRLTRRGVMLGNQAFMEFV